MKKRGAKFKAREARAPTIVAQNMHLEYEIQPRMCVEAFANNYATPEHFNILVSLQDMLIYGLQEKFELLASVVVHDMSDILNRVKAKYEETGTLVASESDITSMRHFIDVYIDYWNRTSGLAFAKAYNHLTNTGAKT